MLVHGAIDFTIVENAADRVVGQMPVQPGILNPYGVVHAGALLWFTDVCATTLALGGTEAGPGRSGFPLAIALHVASDVQGVVIVGSGHWLIEEAPEQVLPLLTAFITE
jgi:acyl-coenzyme A thioesterase PaaI-like protein